MTVAHIHIMNADNWFACRGLRYSGGGGSFAFIELNIIVLMAGPLLSTLSVELWYSYAAGEISEFFFCAGICSLENNLEEPVYRYLVLIRICLLFLSKLRYVPRWTMIKQRYIWLENECQGVIVSSFLLHRDQYPDLLLMFYFYIYFYFNGNSEAEHLWMMPVQKEL